LSLKLLIILAGALYQMVVSQAAFPVYLTGEHAFGANMLLSAQAPAWSWTVRLAGQRNNTLRTGQERFAIRGRLILMAQAGIANQSIAEQLNLSRPTVLAPRAAFAKYGIAAVPGVRRRKRKGSVLTAELEKKVLDTTLQTRPGDGSTQWSVRTLAKQLRVSRTIVHKVWQRHDVQPHRVERFKLSNDPRFEEKVRDIVGLYLNPQDRAVV
jgi:hypothetical protein